MAMYDDQRTDFEGTIRFIKDVDAGDSDGREEAGCVTPTGMSAPLTREDILFTQRLLKSQGLYKGRLDGSWGPKTEAAVTEAEARANQIAAQFGTFDSRSESNIMTLNLKAQETARVFLGAFANVTEYTVKIISGTRTYAEQNALYAQGRTRKGEKVTNARGGSSNHNFGIAWDIGIFVKGKYLDDGKQYKQAAAVALAATTGLEWGGNWTTIVDRPHYQLVTGKTIKEVRELFEDGKAYLSA
jgi:peptidoglycan L-alanyl-D-glutamate endopeptidase CwlK